MPLTDNQKKAITAWFQEHAIEEKCVVCLTAKYVLADDIFSLPVRGIVGGPAAHMVMTACPNCCHSRLYSADGMGLPGLAEISPPPGPRP